LDRDLELAVMNHEGAHASGAFRRVLDGKAVASA